MCDNSWCWEAAGRTPAPPYHAHLADLSYLIWLWVSKMSTEARGGICMNNQLEGVWSLGKPFWLEVTCLAKEYFHVLFQRAYSPTGQEARGSRMKVYSGRENETWCLESIGLQQAQKGILPLSCLWLFNDCLYKDKTLLLLKRSCSNAWENLKVLFGF